VAIVVTAADKRRGRNQLPSPTPVKEAALSMGLAVSHLVGDVTAVRAELGVVVAFGRIIKPDVLARLPMVNVHFSLLPRWRGAAPVERAILAGDRATGVCLMEVEEGLDTGGVFRRIEVPIGDHETAADLTSRLSRLGATLLVEALDQGLGKPEPQVGEPTYAAKIEPAELELHFDRPAADLERVVRVGRAWTTWRGRRLLVVDAEAGADRTPRPEVPGPGVPGPDPTGIEAPGSRRLGPGDLGSGGLVGTGGGVLHLLTVQPEGRAPLPVADWLRGARPQPGESLG
jgi:methionyl-tRNA formyltransferase